MLFLIVNGELMRQQLPKAAVPLAASRPGGQQGLQQSWGAAGAGGQHAEQPLPLGAEQTFPPMLCSAAVAPHKWVFPSASQALCSSLQRENKLKLVLH